MQEAFFYSIFNILVWRSWNTVKVISCICQNCCKKPFLFIGLLYIFLTGCKHKVCTRCVKKRLQNLNCCITCIVYINTLFKPISNKFFELSLVTRVNLSYVFFELFIKLTADRKFFAYTQLESQGSKSQRIILSLKLMTHCSVSLCEFIEMMEVFVVCILSKQKHFA